MRFFSGCASSLPHRVSLLSAVHLSTGPPCLAAASWSASLLKNNLKRKAREPDGIAGSRRFKLSSPTIRRDLNPATAAHSQKHKIPSDTYRFHLLARFSEFCLCCNTEKKEGYRGRRHPFPPPPPCLFGRVAAHLHTGRHLKCSRLKNTRKFLKKQRTNQCRFIPLCDL